MTQNSASLADLKPGQSGTVAQVDCSNRLGRRLLELGLTPGAVVQVEGCAPLGDPLIICARGCRMGIRRCEARCVPVLPCGSPCNAPCKAPCDSKAVCCAAGRGRVPAAGGRRNRLRRRRGAGRGACGCS